MPLQIYANPNLAPELMYAGSNALGQGIAGGLSKFGEAFSAAQDQKKKESQEFDALLKLGEVRGWFDKDTGKTWSLGTLRGVVQARTGQELSDLHKAQMQHLAEQTAASALQRQNMAAAPAFLGELSKYGAAPESIPSPLSNAYFDRYTQPIDLRALGQAAEKTGYAPPMNTLDDLLRAAGGNEAGQFYNPKDRGKAIQLKDEQGNPLPGQFVVGLGPKQGQIINMPTGAPTVWTDPETKEMFYYNGKHNVHIPTSHAMDPLLKLHILNESKALLESPEMMGKSAQQRQDAVNALYKKYELLSKPGAANTPPAPAGGETFATIGAAKAAGKKAGDTIQLWDPTQQRYRGWKME